MLIRRPRTWQTAPRIRPRACSRLASEDPAVNSAGDVTFHAKVKNGGRRRFLFYPDAGAGLVIASQGDAASGGGSFRKFGPPSITDGGDVGLVSDLDSGNGAFVREAGGTIVRAAASGDPSPTGGTFDQLQAERDPARTRAAESSRRWPRRAD